MNNVNIPNSVNNDKIKKINKINVLAIDTSTEAYSVACCRYENKFDNSSIDFSSDTITELLANIEIVDDFAIAPCKHSQQILPAIQNVMNQCQLTFSDLTCLAFAHGPGSFTGLRLATSIIHGLALAHDLPIVKISTLQAIAQEAYCKHHANTAIVALDARMEEIYFGLYKASSCGLMSPIIEDILIAPTDISIKKLISQYKKYFVSDIIGIGNAWKVYNNSLHEHNLTELIELKTIIDQDCYPQARYVLMLAIKEYLQHKTVNLDDALPLYLRNNVVHSNNNKNNTNK